MPDIASIRFPTNGKLYDFDSTGHSLKPGDTVVVESELGLSLGSVVVVRHDVETPPERQHKPVVRKATADDILQTKENESLKKEALAFCNERIMARGLLMKLVHTDCTLDRKRIIFYFVADTRIDFRELVKDLASKFRTRIELRQIGVRDEARITGCLGVCGRELCCRTFLTTFEPISIKMAKRQDLSLNTSKLSGVCGRLMCCLNYEFQNYKPGQKIQKEVPEEVATEEVVVITDADVAEQNKPVATPPAERSQARPRQREERQRRPLDRTKPSSVSTEGSSERRPAQRERARLMSPEERKIQVQSQRHKRPLQRPADAPVRPEGSERQVDKPATPATTAPTRHRRRRFRRPEGSSPGGSPTSGGERPSS